MVEARCFHKKKPVLGKMPGLGSLFGAAGGSRAARKEARKEQALIREADQDRFDMMIEERGEIGGGVGGAVMEPEEREKFEAEQAAREAAILKKQRAMQVGSSEA